MLFDAMAALMQRPDAAQDPQYATIKAMFDTVHQQVGQGGTHIYQPPIWLLYRLLSSPYLIDLCTSRWAKAAPQGPPALRAVAVASGRRNRAPWRRKRCEEEARGHGGGGRGGAHTRGGCGRQTGKRRDTVSTQCAGEQSHYTAQF
jgi:hypothetical protein